MRIKACLFDLYGTLLDLQSVLILASSPLGPLADSVLSLWRQKQLEYSWVNSLRGTYRNFEELTKESLRYALAYHKIQDERVFDILAQAYEQLKAYDDVKNHINALKKSGLITGILSNGSPGMIDKGLQNAGLADMFSPVLSIDKVRIFKPAPLVYQMACDELQLDKSEIGFVSANSWDAAGAHQFGLQVVRIMRGAILPNEYQTSSLPTITNLGQLQNCLMKI